MTYIGKGTGITYDEMEGVYRKRAEEIVGNLKMRYPDDVEFEMTVERAYSVRIDVYACERGIRIDIGCELLQMPDNALMDLIECIIDATMEGVEYKLPHLALEWIDENVWKIADRPVTDCNIPPYSKMSPQAKEAFKLLRDSGLLDDVPEGTVVRHSPSGRTTPDVARRIIYIPYCVIVSDTDPSELAQGIYRGCILDLVVKHALVKGMNMRAAELGKEMMDYAVGVIKADGETAEE